MHGAAVAQAAATLPRTSLELSCPNEAFVSVSASTPKRDAFPSVQLTLTDPLSRKNGEGGGNKLIPRSRYGNLVEIPREPQRSRALAIEVCNAKQGIYQTNIYEHGDVPYLVTVRGVGSTDRRSLLLHHIAREGRVRHYKFKFKINAGKVMLVWLDADNHPLLRVEDNEW